MNHDRPVVYIGDALWMQGALWAAGEPEPGSLSEKIRIVTDNSETSNDSAAGDLRPAQRCPLCHGAVVAGECQGCGMAMDL